MSDNWVVQNLQNALNVWNDKLTEIWQLITQSPETFRGGAIWNIILDIFGALQAIGYALLVLFFVVGVVKTCGSFSELKRPEVAVKMFVRFALAKGAITYGMDLMLALLEIVQGVISAIMNAAGFGARLDFVSGDGHRLQLLTGFLEVIFLVDALPFGKVEGFADGVVAHRSDQECISAVRNPVDVEITVLVGRAAKGGAFQVDVGEHHRLACSLLINKAFDGVVLGKGSYGGQY